MGELTTNLKTFGKDFVYPPETTRIETDTVWIAQQLIDAGIMGGEMKRLVLDSRYWLCTKDEFVSWVQWDWVNKKKFVIEKYDCDNFAFSFKARTDRKFGINSVGLVIDYSGSHVYNVVVFADSPPELYEPQNDKWIKKGQGKLYTCTNGYIII